MSNQLARMRYGDVPYRLISDLTSDYAYVCRLDADGSVTCEWQSHSEFLGHQLHESDICGGWLSAVHPDDLPIFDDLIDELRENRTVTTDLRALSREGEVRWLRLYARPEWDAGLRRVVTVHGAVQDITIHKRGDLDKTTLLQIAHDLDGTLDVDELLTRVQRRTSAALPCDVVITFLWDTEAAAFRPRSQHGAAPELVEELRALQLPKGTFGGQTERGKTIVLNDMAAQSWLSRPLCSHFGIRALIAAPLRVRGRHLGTLAAYNTTSAHGFTERDAELCTAIAGQIAVAVEAAELHQASQEQAIVSGALARAGQELIASLDGPTDLNRFCQLVADVLGCDVCHTWLWNDKDDAYVPAGTYGDSREQWELMRILRLPRSALESWRTEHSDVTQIVVADQPNAAMRAGALNASVVLQIRLRRGESMFGIVSAGFRYRRTPFNSVQMRIARGIAQMASMALSHARLVDELARANRLKSDFVATMSHELRTPLNALMGYTDLLACGEFGEVNPEQQEVLGRMDRAARELLNLINATLDLSRIEARQVPLDIEPVDVQQLLQEIDAEARPLYERRGLGFSWSNAADVSVVHTDRLKLKVILKNLVANALKFTECGRVFVAAEPHGNGLQVSVCDTGIGIAPEVLPVIFEPFRQGESAETRHYGGVGLGLYVVRRLLDLLGGTINVETAPGNGSTFRVWVPVQL